MLLYSRYNCWYYRTVEQELAELFWGRIVKEVFHKVFNDFRCLGDEVVGELHKLDSGGVEGFTVNKEVGHSFNKGAGGGQETQSLFVAG